MANKGQEMAHPGGRPLKFKSVEEMQVMIDAYFDKTPEEEWTVTGLALALGTYRDVLISYQQKDKFSNAIKTAKEKVHNSYEKDLRKKGRSGDIFALKNFGWRDNQDLNLGGQKDNPLGVTLKIVMDDGSKTNKKTD